MLPAFSFKRVSPHIQPFTLMSWAEHSRRADSWQGSTAPNQKLQWELPTYQLLISLRTAQTPSTCTCCRADEGRQPSHLVIRSPKRLYVTGCVSWHYLYFSPPKTLLTDQKKKQVCLNPNSRNLFLLVRRSPHFSTLPPATKKSATDTIVQRGKKH